MADRAIESRISDALARLGQLEDERAILQTLYQYSHAMNAKQRSAWLDVFAEDGSWAAKSSPQSDWSFEVRGQHQLGLWYDEHAREWALGEEGHAVVSPSVRINGDRAEATSVYISMRRADGQLVLRSTGFYEDVLVRCADRKWRIKERRAIGNISHRPAGG